MHVCGRAACVVGRRMQCVDVLLQCCVGRRMQCVDVLLQCCVGRRMQCVDVLLQCCVGRCMQCDVLLVQSCTRVGLLHAHPRAMTAAQPALSVMKTSLVVVVSLTRGTPLPVSLSTTWMPKKAGFAADASATVPHSRHSGHSIKLDIVCIRRLM
jgi:hypothetical protein